MYKEHNDTSDDDNDIRDAIYILFIDPWVTKPLI